MCKDRDRFVCVVPGGKAESQPCQLSLLVRGGGCPAWLLSCGGGDVGDGQSDGTVAEIGDEVQSASEGLDVAGDDLEGGDLAVLDLGYPGDAHGLALAMSIRTLALLRDSGSQTGSQQPQAQGHARPRPAIIVAAERHARPRRATSGDTTGMPPKQ
jgi:hypothetical protein